MDFSVPGMAKTSTHGKLLCDVFLPLRHVVPCREASGKPGLALKKIANLDDER